MFTVIVSDERGQAATECQRYKFVRGTYNEDNSVATVDRLELINETPGSEHLVPQEPHEVLRIGDCFINVLNSNGKTVARWEPYAPSHPMYRAVRAAGPNPQTHPCSTGEVTGVAERGMPESGSLLGSAAFAELRRAAHY